MNIRRFLTTSIALATISAGAFAADTFVVDKSHSSTAFKVRHLIAKTSGRFNDFTGTITLDRAKLQNSSVEFTIKTASIDTDNEGRDKHLRSADFFDAEKYPEITFKSTKITPAGKDKYNVTGNFTMHGVTKTITLPVEITGFMKDPRGTERAGFQTALTLNRKDYGIEWNKNLDEGGLLLGDDVEVSIELETIAKKPEAAAAAATK